MVKNDRFIKNEDKAAFTYELSKRLNDGEEYNKNLAEIYKYMKYDLRYNGEQMQNIFNKIE